MVSDFGSYFDFDSSSDCGFPCTEENDSLPDRDHYTVPFLLHEDALVRLVDHEDSRI